MGRTQTMTDCFIEGIAGERLTLTRLVRVLDLIFPE